MLKNQKLLLFSSVFFLGLFLSDSSTAREGCITGINLWLFTIVPALFPFMFFSEILKSTNGFVYISKIFSPLTTQIFKLSKNGSYPLLIGLLCGFPMGAKASSDLVSLNKISFKEGEYLLSFCNILSPGFITGYYCNFVLKDNSLLFPALFSIYFSHILVGLLLRFSGYDDDFNYISTDDSSETMPLKFDKIFLDTFINLAKIGSFILLFSLICAYIQHLFLPAAINIALISSFEITTGLGLMETSHISIMQKFLIGNTAISFGGISGIAQTKSIISKSGLSVKKYISSKILISFLFFFFLIF